MTDKPSEVIKAKRSTSMQIGLEMLDDGRADAMVSMGNTGALFGLAMLHAPRRLPLVKRPALSTFFDIYDKRHVFLDIGANADSKPEWLAQFALMGSLCAQHMLGYDRPRIATLSNGEEEGKGNQLVLETAQLIRAKMPDIGYIGHVEPAEILQQKAEVIVMDGFVGNVFLKTFEGSIRYFGGLLREEIASSLLAKVGGGLMTPAFRHVRQRLDTEQIGGAPLLGVDGVLIIGHGGSSALAVCNAILQAQRMVDSQLTDIIRRGIEQYFS